MVHAERLAGSLRLPKLNLHTNQRSASNIEFHSRHGFAVDREEAFMGGFKVHMSKRVTPA